MYNEYFAPYRAAVEADVGSVMSSFNIVDGIDVYKRQFICFGRASGTYTGTNP